MSKAQVQVRRVENGGPKDYKLVVTASDGVGNFLVHESLAAYFESCLHNNELARYRFLRKKVKGVRVATTW
jgi:hypothetical protein